MIYILTGGPATGKGTRSKILAKELNIPHISILEVELIINKQLFDEGVINEKQYYEVSKIIYEKIHQLKNQRD